MTPSSPTSPTSATLWRCDIETDDHFPLCTFAMGPASSNSSRQRVALPWAQPVHASRRQGRWRNAGRRSQCS
ncbi:hypothetical protein Ddc_21161 [Ditylenchus destructor]|nr:hypothetical protein Ddc_21161 [Ditylenchus destructor]